MIKICRFVSAHLARQTGWFVERQNGLILMDDKATDKSFVFVGYVRNGTIAAQFFLAARNFAQ